MFRTKTKKKAGNATRKRKDIDDGDENEEQYLDQAKTESMEVDETEIPSTNDAIKAPNDHDEEEGEDAMLARMRNRMNKNKAKASSTMSFSSKAKKTVKKGAMDDEDATIASVTGGCLSFEEDTTKASKKESKKMRIRPNLHVAHTSEVDDEDNGQTNMYSHDMLASLLREQKVLLRRAPPVPETREEDHNAMEVDEEEGQVAFTADEETKGESAEEEFIPLNAKLMQAKKNKKRVTFGVQNDEFYPPKDAEVEEPVSASDAEDDEDRDQSKRWEEELMRRGGGHNVPMPQPTAARYDSKAIYPTRKKVPCASLGEVMRSIQRKMEAGTVERDRVARELARLDAESQLIQKKLLQQREELLVSSEQFEYFQVIEDFVKGLSFCLREKLPSIEIEEKRRASVWMTLHTNLRNQRDFDMRAEIRACLGANTIKDRQFVNLPSDITEPVAGDNKTDADARMARFQTRYANFVKYKAVDSSWDVFADAVDEMNSIERVYGRFQEWKSKFPDVYKDTHTDLALSKLYAPYVRVELINWDPLTVTKGGVGPNTASKRVSEMKWFKTLQLHQSQQRRELEEPVISLLRDIVISRMADATKTRFDSFSPIHTQSIADLIEDLIQLNALPHVEHGVEEVIGNVLSTLTAEAKRLPGLALDQQDATNDRTRFFALFLVDELCALLENALALFVALPSGTLHERGFNSVMQILHHVLAYVTNCKHLNKTTTLPQIHRTIKQLSSSSFMQSLLARTQREQLEFQRVLELLQPKSAT